MLQVEYHNVAHFGLKLLMSAMRPHSHLLDIEMCRFVSKYKHCSGAVAQWVALSPRMHQALGSIPNINQRHTQVIPVQRKWKQEDHVFKMIHGYVAC